MIKTHFLLAGCVLLLSGCAGVKSSFDCDATTSDTCITMTKANQLARDKAAKQAGKTAVGGLPSLVNLPEPFSQAALTPSAISMSPVKSARTLPTVVTPTIASAVPYTPTLVSGHTGGLLSPRPVSGTPVSATGSSPVLALLPARPVTLSAPSCQSVRCDNPGSAHPLRSQDQIATVWIAPWVDSDNAFHQPGRVSFVAAPAEWVLPSRVN